MSTIPTISVRWQNWRQMFISIPSAAARKVYHYRQKPNGKPKYISGMRGAIERNTMRYYLAIEAYLGSLSRPPAQQEEYRLKNWFAATQRYPQLYEITQQQYLSMKRDELKQTPPNN